MSARAQVKAVLLTCLLARLVLRLGTCRVALDPLLHVRRSEEGEVRTKPANRKEGKPEPKANKEHVDRTACSAKQARERLSGAALPRAPGRTVPELRAKAGGAEAAKPRQHGLQQRLRSVQGKKERLSSFLSWLRSTRRS